MEFYTEDAVDLSKQGYVVIPDVLPLHEVDDVARRVDSVLADKASRKLLEVEWCWRLALKLGRDSRLRPLLPAEMHPAQCTLFAKTAQNNWLVSLHQDLSVPVAGRVDSPSCTGWCEKEGSMFVQPPAYILEGLEAVRLHIDECTEQNGALRVVPGSHRLGRLSPDAALHERRANGVRAVSVAKGGVMVMRPLLLHASSKSDIARPRRVLHFVFGPKVLSEGLRWATRRDRNPRGQGRPSSSP